MKIYNRKRAEMSTHAQARTHTLVLKVKKARPRLELALKKRNTCTLLD